MDRNLFIRYNRLAEIAQLKRGTRESMEWFAKRIRKDPPVALDRVVNNFERTRIAPGKMFAYSYDPKLKDKLPYYDENPLVIILDVRPDGWYGANIHYLPPKLRVDLMEQVIVKKRSGLQIAKILESNRMTKVCLKRYLVKHLVTRPKEIPQNEWEICIQLPFESFMKATLRDVWSNSKKKI